MLPALQVLVPVEIEMVAVDVHGETLAFPQTFHIHEANVHGANDHGWFL